MTAVQKKMEEFIRRERLLEMGDRVVLGVSGGADSVCMMELFAAIRKAWQLELLVVHVHHGLRGAEADRDAAPKTMERLSLWNQTMEQQET